MPVPGKIVSLAGRAARLYHKYNGGMEWKPAFEIELQKARQARLKGKEGQARVLARRAAGYPLRVFYQQPENINAYALLERLKEEESAPPAARLAAERLTRRVDEDFGLPSEIDLLQEAEALAKALFPVAKISKGE